MYTIHLGMVVWLWTLDFWVGVLADLSVPHCPVVHSKTNSVLCISTTFTYSYQKIDRSRMMSNRPKTMPLCCMLSYHNAKAGRSSIEPTYSRLLLDHSMQVYHIGSSQNLSLYQLD